MVNWGIALFEYWLAVPANRWGSAVYTAAQFKTMQEVITLIVLAGFSVLFFISGRKVGKRRATPGRHTPPKAGSPVLRFKPPATGGLKYWITRFRG